MERIASFSVDHNILEPGIYVSRSDSDESTGCITTTFDLRMTAPNREPVMDTAQYMHSNILALLSFGMMKSGKIASSTLALWVAVQGFISWYLGRTNQMMSLAW